MGEVERAKVHRLRSNSGLWSELSQQCIGFDGHASLYLGRSSSPACSLQPPPYGPLLIVLRCFPLLVLCSQCKSFTGAAS